MFLACYAYFGRALATLKYCAFGFLLLGLIFTDAETQLLPDKMTLPGLALGLLFSLVFRSTIWLRAICRPGLPTGKRTYPAIALAAARPDGRGSGRFVHLWSGRDLSARSRRRGNGLWRRQADGDGWRVPRPFDHLHYIYCLDSRIAVGLWTVLVVWIKRTRRRMTAIMNRRERHGAGHGNRPRIALRRHQMPFGVFLGSMAMVALFYGNQFSRWYWGLL